MAWPLAATPPLLLLLLLPLPRDVKLRLLAIALDRAFAFQLVPVDRELVLDRELVIPQRPHGRKSELPILQFHILEFFILLIRPVHRAGQLVPVLRNRQRRHSLLAADLVLQLPRPN